MNNYQVKMPSCVYGGVGSIRNIKEVLIKEGTKKVILFTDKGVREAGLIQGILEILDEVGVNYEIFDSLVPEPSIYDVEKVMKEVESSQGEMIVAIGGGSVLDAAKLCVVLKNAEYTLRDLLKDSTIAKKQMKSIMIPTTCGTGSEATCNAIVTIQEEDLKVGIVSGEMISDYVVLDPEMIANLPQSIIAATGVDALAHAVECFTSKKANPFSDTYALAAAKLLFGSIKEAYTNKGNLSAKANMLLGAFYAGVAITASGTTAVHALSYPLGGKYHIAHGISNAILFAHVMAFNKEACEDRLAVLCDSINQEMSAASDADKAQYVIDLIAEIVAFTQIPTNLKSFGITEQDMTFLVQAASKVTRLLVNNRRELSLDDIRSIYQKVI
jgi:alcohol dehydrogenase class IV